MKNYKVYAFWHVHELKLKCLSLCHPKILTPFLFNYMELGSTPKTSSSFIVHHIEKITSIPCGKCLGEHHCPFWKNRDSHPMRFFIIPNFLKISINICFKPSFMCSFKTINYFFQFAYKVLSTLANEFGWLFQIHLFFNFYHWRLHFATFKCMWCAFHPQKVVIKMTNLIVI